MTPCSAHAIALFPSLPSLPSSALHMSTSRKRKKRKRKNQESTDTAERALPPLHESARINTTVLCFLPFHHFFFFFFFSGKQIHARNHSKPSVLFRSHTHTHTRYWENAFRAQVSAINNALVILLAGFPETCSPPHHLNQFTFCTDASPGLSSK